MRDLEFTSQVKRNRVKSNISKTPPNHFGRFGTTFFFILHPPLRSLCLFQQREAVRADPCGRTALPDRAFSKQTGEPRRSVQRAKCLCPRVPVTLLSAGGSFTSVHSAVLLVDSGARPGACPLSLSAGRGGQVHLTLVSLYTFTHSGALFCCSFNSVWVFFWFCLSQTPSFWPSCSLGICFPLTFPGGQGN